MTIVFFSGVDEVIRGFAGKELIGCSPQQQGRRHVSLQLGVELGLGDWKLKHVVLE
jgi:hypothetical protein